MANKLLTNISYIDILSKYVIDLSTDMRTEIDLIFKVGITSEVGKAYSSGIPDSGSILAYF